MRDTESRWSHYNASSFRWLPSVAAEVWEVLDLSMGQHAIGLLMYADKHRCLSRPLCLTTPLLQMSCLCVRPAFRLCNCVLINRSSCQALRNRKETIVLHSCNKFVERDNLGEGKPPNRSLTKELSTKSTFFIKFSEERDDR